MDEMMSVNRKSSSMDVGRFIFAMVIPMRHSRSWHKEERRVGATGYNKVWWMSGNLP